MLIAEHELLDPPFLYPLFGWWFDLVMKYDAYLVVPTTMIIICIFSFFMALFIRWLCGRMGWCQSGHNGW